MGAGLRFDRSDSGHMFGYCAAVLMTIGLAGGCDDNPFTPSPDGGVYDGGARQIDASTQDASSSATNDASLNAQLDASSDAGIATSDASVASFLFTVSPIAVANVQSLEPLGHLNPPAHTFPTDHMYLFHHVGRESDPPYEVVAPADGVVVMVQREADDAIYIAASPVHTYYLGHMIVDSSITATQHVTAGQHLGTTGPISHAIDIGVLNATVENAFINHDRYSGNSRHAEPPYRYMTPALQTELGPLFNTTPDNREGVFVFDMPGTLSGNWFHNTLEIWESVGPAAGPKHIAFVRDTADPTKHVVSLGGTVGIAGVYFMEPTDPDPQTVTPSSGAVTFHLSNMQQGTTGVPMIVTMTGESTVRVQFQDHDETYTR